MSVAAVRPTELDIPRDVQRAVELLFDRKATDVILLDLRGLSTATDFFLLASGRSDTQVTAIAEHLVQEMAQEGVRAGSVEGLRGGRWVLVDYFDFVVHVFHPDARDFYQLERLWGDAPTHQLMPEDSADSPQSD
jgi:ribosome-associated protein